MDRLLPAIALVGVAVVVALVLSRRRPDAPTQAGWQVPTQLDRADFSGTAASWLVVVFTSAACHTCAGVLEKARQLACDEVAVQEAEVSTERELHERYGIEAVPTLVVADAQGVVRASYLGPVTATDLWAAVAELREPGVLPPDGCDAGGGLPT